MYLTLVSHFLVPVFKIVDRSGWYMVTYIPKNHKDRYAVSKKYSVIIDDKYEIKATLKNVSAEGNKMKMVFESDYYFKGFSTIRTAKVKIITSGRGKSALPTGGGRFTSEISLRSN